MNRRDFLKTAGLATVNAPFWMGIMPENLWAKVPTGIKVTEIKTFIVRNAVYVKIYTNQGITGLGQANVQSLELAIDGAIKDLGRLLIGKDPIKIEYLWQVMFRWPRAHGGAVLNSAISALDIALWDILGKVMDAPIYMLTGGAVRDKVRVYAHCYSRLNPEGMREAVLKVKEEGFTAIRTALNFVNWKSRIIERPWKFNMAVKTIEIMREAAGEDVDIIDDAHGLMTPVMVMEYCKAIEPYRLLFLEDPVQPENIPGLKWIQDHTTVPLAIGENNYTKLGFREIIHNHLVNYVRPDALWAGGITECKKIAAMAEASFIDVCLHGGGTVNSLAATHISASTPNCVLQEPRSGTSDMFYGDGITVTNGYAALPEKPGLGCDLNEEIAKKYPYEPGTLPYLSYEDGSVSDY
ncbi:enolase C-terminal domain-like protein [Candidatus Latescibacterota bacterium]